MTRPDWIETLRADLRPADPDPVLLAQLVELSSRSAVPVARSGRSVGARLAMVLGGVIAVGATSWAAGALPGTESPFGPEEHVTHQPADPTPSEDVTAPPSDAPASPSQRSTDTADGPGQSGATPSSDRPDDTPAGTGVPPGQGGEPPGRPGDLELPSQVPDLPELPDLPSVPTDVVPPGLDRLPTQLPELRGSDPADDSDSGNPRSPRPQEAQVDQAQ